MKKLLNRVSEVLNNTNISAIFAFLGDFLWKNIPGFGVFGLLGKESKTTREEIFKKLEEAEKTPVVFAENQGDLRFLELVQKGDKYLKTTHSGKLIQRIVGLKYRLEEANGGVDPDEFNIDCFDLVREAAIQWKKSHPLIGEAILSANEINHLKTASKFTLFVDMILNFEDVRENFFNWVLRDENDVIPFIEFPAIVEKIMQSNISGRISRFGGCALKIQKINTSNGLQKILTLPMEGKDLSILDPNAKVTFRGSYTLTIAEIFNIFARKEFEVGNLEFMKEGIINWNLHQLAFWDAKLQKHIQIDIEKDDWWKQLPFYQVVTAKQLSKQYQIEIKTGEWVVCAKATRGRPNLDFEETHAFLEVVIPVDNGHYAIYDFGKLALEYPETRLDKLFMAMKTVHATVAYPDDNIFYTHRQHGFHPFVISAARGRKMMESLRKDIITSRKSNFIYQIESENCAKWVHQKIESVEEMPDLFRMQLLDCEPQGVVAHVFSWIKKLPQDWQVPVMTFLHLPLGAFRKVWIEENGERVAKSLSTHSFFETGQVFLPALLIARLFEKGNRIFSSCTKAIGLMLKFFQLPRFFGFTLRHIITLWVRYVASDQARIRLRSPGLFSPPPPVFPGLTSILSFRQRSF